MTTICKRIYDSVNEFFSCEGKEKYTVLHTPFLYPDGDCISLYIEPNPDGTFTVSDFGETMRWIRCNTPSMKRTPKQNLIIQDICLTHSVEFINGTLQIAGLQEVEIPEVVFRVSQAAIRVSDIWLTFRNRTIQSTVGEISEYFDENSIKYERNKKEIGRSGRSWSIDFYTETVKKHSLVSLLSTGSRQSAKGFVEHVFACFSDIRNADEFIPQRLCVSVVDDTYDIWENSDFYLLSQVSEVALWSEPEKILTIIGA